MRSCSRYLHFSCFDQRRTSIFRLRQADHQAEHWAEDSGRVDASVQFRDAPGLRLRYELEVKLLGNSGVPVIGELGVADEPEEENRDPCYDSHRHRTLTWRGDD